MEKIGERPSVEAQSDLLRRLRHYGDNDRDAACALIEQLGADLFKAEGRADMLSRAYASSQGGVGAWVTFGSSVAEALGLQVMSPEAVLAEIARLKSDLKGRHQRQHDAEALAGEYLMQRDDARAKATPTPLTDAQIEEGRMATFSTNNPFCPCDSKTMRKAVRWAERAHGITDQAAKREPNEWQKRLQVRAEIEGYNHDD